MLTSEMTNSIAIYYDTLIGWSWWINITTITIETIFYLLETHYYYSMHLSFTKYVILQYWTIKMKIIIMWFGCVFEAALRSRGAFFMLKFSPSLSLSLSPSLPLLGTFQALWLVDTKNAVLWLVTMFPI